MKDVEPDAVLKTIRFAAPPETLVEVVAVAALPLMSIAQVPDAPEPVVEGTDRFVRAPAAVVAPVPPLVTFSVPVRTIATAVGAEGLNPVVPAEKVVTPPAVEKVPHPAEV